MSPEEREDYLNSKAFGTALYQVKKNDRAYQLLQRGELALDFHQAEFERLAPMILDELEQGNPVRLDPLFCARWTARVSLKKARAAIALLEKHAVRPGCWTSRRSASRTRRMKVERYLRRADFSRMIDGEKRAERVADHLMKTTFARGVSSTRWTRPSAQIP